MEESHASKLHKATFHGKGDEYFKIWIVNLLLNIITLGTYSAWGKVRSLKYFYGATELDNNRFDFHGDPLAILKGRIISIIIFSLYSYSGAIHPIIPAFGLVLMFFFIPWVTVKTLKFKFANTSFKNIFFSFRGSLDEAFKIWFKHTLYPFAAMLVLIVISLCNIYFKDNIPTSGKYILIALILIIGLSIIIYLFVTPF